MLPSHAYSTCARAGINLYILIHWSLLIHNELNVWRHWISFNHSRVHAFIETVIMCHLSLSKSTYNASPRLNTHTTETAFNSVALVHQTLWVCTHKHHWVMPTLQHHHVLSRPWTCTQHMQHFTICQEEGFTLYTLPQLSILPLPYYHYCKPTHN